MTWYKHDYIGGNLGNTQQFGSMAIGGGFEQSVFQDDITGYKIFWAFELIFRQVGNLYKIRCEPVDGSMSALYGVTIQASNVNTGEILGTCIVNHDVNEIGVFSKYYETAHCNITVTESNPDNIFLEII